MTFTSDRTATAHVLWTCFLGGKCFVFPRSKKESSFRKLDEGGNFDNEFSRVVTKKFQQQIATFDGIASPVPCRSSFSW